MVKISVIVPVYRAELYIKKCIESILNQTHTNIELILVNDGSPDKSGLICDSYAVQDSRITVLHQQNQGVSVARNNGIDLVTGDYLIFVDSDDWIETDFLETYIGEVEQSGSDLIYQGLVNEHADGTTLLKLPFGRFQNETVADAILIVEYLECLGGACNKLFKSKIIKDNQIRFLPGLSFGEDKIFTLQYFEQVTTLTLLDACKYHYNRISEDSLSRSHHSSEDLFQLIEQEYLLFNRLNHKFRSDALLHAVNGRYLSMSKYALLAMYRPHMLKSRSERLQQIRKIKKFKNDNQIDLKFDRDVPRIVDVLIDLNSDLGLKLSLSLRHKFSGIYQVLRGKLS